MISFEVGPVQIKLKQRTLCRSVTNSTTKLMHNMAKRVDTPVSERLNSVARNGTTGFGKLKGTTVSQWPKHPATLPLPWNAEIKANSRGTRTSLLRNQSFLNRGLRVAV